MRAYLPVLGFALAIMAALLVTAADRRGQLAGFARRFDRAARSKRRRRRWTPQRIALCAAAIGLALYIWTYQRMQDAIAAELTAAGIDQVAVGSLILPASGFAQSLLARPVERIDAGFFKSKTRARAAVDLRGHLLTGFTAAIDEAAMARISKVAGRKFVFAYLTDVKILRPAINRHMDELVRARQIDKYEIETFDNRGPYLLVALSADNRAKDAAAVATALAQGLYANLTQTHQLKVNQVVIKVLDPQPYLDRGAVAVIARGTAGTY